MMILDMFSFIILIVLAGVLFALAFFIIWLVRSPFQYPYFEYTFDVSRKRLPDINDYLDNFLIDGGMNAIYEHQNKIDEWKKNCQEKIKNGRFKKRRQQQFARAIDDEHAYCFYFTRNQTRYQQRNYVKTSYQVETLYNSFSYDFAFIKSCYDELSKIGFECSRRKYHMQEQRRLMTPELKDSIKKRDNYTCQQCHKVMYDEVELHIDHIIPVSKGGKSVPSNLRVLCSKCNGRKSNKVE